MYAEHWVKCLCALGKIISLTNIISPGATEMVSATDNSEREGSGISLSVCVCVCSVAQMYPILCDHMGYSPPGFSVHGIFHAKNTGMGCHFLFQGIFLTQDQTCVSCVSSTGRWILYCCAIWEAFITSMIHPKYTFPFWSLCIIIILKNLTCSPPN